LRGHRALNSISHDDEVRVLAGQAHSMRQQVIRVDYESAPLAGTQIEMELGARLREVVGGAEAVIVSDYNYGVAGAQIIERVRDATRASAVPVLIDSRFRLLDFSPFHFGHTERRRS
jgi:bifunctional ADP-heptose synthase (sugar kinase/adenylyltransferase)